jgi:hypothetical protein
MQARAGPHPRAARDQQPAPRRDRYRHAVFLPAKPRPRRSGARGDPDATAELIRGNFAHPY